MAAPAGRRPTADGSRSPDGRDPPSALVEDLAELATSTDDLTAAVNRHDLAALLAANGRAEELVARLRARSGDLTDVERGRLDMVRVRVLQDRIDVAARRNAYLIERAWAVDAATMRLLASLGRPAGDGPGGPYAPPPGPGYLDRQA
jgi:hypothetical protein